MPLFAECPTCHKKQAMKNRSCEKCGEDLESAKKAKRVRLWVIRKLPNGKREVKYVGSSIGDLLKPYMRKHRSSNG